MAARFGNAVSHGRRVTGDDAPLYQTAPVAKGIGMSQLKRGATAAGFNARVGASLGMKAATATPKRKLATAGAAGVATGAAMAGRPNQAQAQPIYVAPYSQMAKGWGGGLSRTAANSARKAKIREGMASRAKDRALHADISRDYPGGLKRITAEDDFSDRSNRKAINFVERFRYDPQSGSRRIANPQYKTSRPRARSLTGEDKTYLGLPGATGRGTRQGTGGSGSVDYQLTGNRSVRKSYRRMDPEHRRQRRMGNAEAGLVLGGGYAGHRGVKGIQADTKALRAAKIRDTVGAKDSSVERKFGRKAIAVSRRNGLLVGGGAAALAAAGGIAHHANSNRGRTYR